MYTYNMLQTCFHRGWPYVEYHACQREIAKHQNNWCSDLDTLDRLAKEEHERQVASGESFCAILARVPAEAVARWGCDIPDSMVAIGSRGCIGATLFWESGRMAYDFLD